MQESPDDLARSKSEDKYSVAFYNRLIQKCSLYASAKLACHHMSVHQPAPNTFKNYGERSVPCQLMSLSCACSTASDADADMASACRSVCEEALVAVVHEVCAACCSAAMKLTAPAANVDFTARAGSRSCKGVYGEMRANAGKR